MKKRLFVQSIVLGTMVILSACHSDKKEIATNYDGKMLMKAVFFRDGDAVKHLPLLDENFDLGKLVKDEKALAKIRSMEDEILDRVAAKNTKAFDEFEKAIRSGNHVVVSQSIDQYGKEIVSAYNELYGNSSVNVNGISAVDFILVSYRYVFVINEFQVQVTIDIENPGLLAFSNKSKQLLHDQLVDSIVKNLTNESES